MTADVDGLSVVPTRLWPQAVSNAIELPVLAKRCHADVVVSHNYAPLSGRNVVFVHDLMFGDHPEWFSRSERAYFGLMAPSLRRASRVVTSSEAEVARIERIAPWVKKVRATGLAVGTSLTHATAEEPQNCPHSFALVVGRLNVRKNLVSAMTAARIAHRITPDNPLVVVGDQLHSGVGGVPQDVQDLVADGTVRFLGRVTDGNLRWLYEHASVTLYLSLDEGFGLPPLEATHFGCPVIVSDIPVLRETVGKVARFVDPHDVRAIAREIDEVSGVPRRRQGAPNGVNAAYAWDRVAAVIRDVAAEIPS
ncbi:MAG TPA: glycosyltransferase family 1 protein [Flexivirga sp.]|uniref:glycosyltransferase family 4 protein n=1 Tax=Flexivirga sp. TaxID=1962927 RepID=UPI002BD45493|nr:glycosyltransferase family 1 protein [Flexivirga sp.]HWC21300.1 glycosyltransferase family 1 protein [Flexivirga sp.]